MREFWVPVADWEDLYEVSNLGRVRSKDRVIESRPGIIRRRRGMVLAPAKVVGYDHVHLSHGRRKQGRYVHRLVARAFLGPCPPGHEVCHGPLGKSVNTPENLRYGTRRQNLKDRERDGTLVCGERSPSAKLTESDVREIRRLAGSVTQSAMAKQFGISRSVIHAIVHGKAWSHLTT